MLSKTARTSSPLPRSSDTSSDIHCRWAAVFQEDRLLEHLNAADNLRFVLGPAYDAVRAEALLCELGLVGVGEKAVRDYSGGMKRRLSLARAAALRCILRAAEKKPVLLAAHESLSLPDGGSVISL